MSGFQAAAVSGSVMILVIALLRLTAGKRLPRALFPALWCAAAFRLLLPVRLPSALSVWNLTAGESRAARTAAQISEHLTPFPSLTAAPAAQEAAAQLSLPGLIWAAGALLLGAYFLPVHAPVRRCGSGRERNGRQLRESLRLPASSCHSLHNGQPCAADLWRPAAGRPAPGRPAGRPGGAADDPDP